MNDNKILNKYRSYFTSALVITVLIVTIVEIAAYIFFISLGMCKADLGDSYLKYKVILPIIINFAVLGVVIYIGKARELEQNVKNRVIVFGAGAVSFVVSAVHREFIVTLGAFMFPMLLSAAFNDRKLFGQSSALALVALSTTIILLVCDKNLDLTAVINIIVMYGFLVVSYIAGVVSINFSQHSFQLIENQQKANKRLHDIVLRDQMTGLYNHRTFYCELDESIKNAKDGKEKFCLAMIDIDDFKSINDQFGHDSGDDVLKTLAKIIEKNCLKEDKPCRYGGEEFAVIFNGKDIEYAKTKVLSMLEEFVKIKYGFEYKPITFSCGIAAYDGNTSREDFFDIADKRLYNAKGNGKNQIVFA